MDAFEPVIGDSTMSNDPAKQWADIVALADGLGEAEDCSDWSDFDGDLFDLALNEGQAEELGVSAGLISQDAKLSTKARKALPDSAFCGPNRSFPVHDAAHVRNALARLPQASTFSADQKARILACVRRRASKLGVKVSADQLEYNQLVSLLDRKDPAMPPAGDTSPPPEGETDVQKIQRLESANRAQAAKIEDQASTIGQLMEDLKDSKAMNSKLLAKRVVNLRTQLEKPDVMSLDTQAKSQEYLARLEMRSVASLTDSVTDLEAEIAAAAPPATPPVDDPTATLSDADKGGQGTSDDDKGGEAAADELSKFRSALKG
jgi:hypothetical protein